MRFRALPIDKQHPNRVAIAYGPVVLAQPEDRLLALSKDDPQAAFQPADKPLQFVGRAAARPLLEPFYRIGYAKPYSIYFDV